MGAYEDVREGMEKAFSLADEGRRSDANRLWGDLRTRYGSRMVAYVLAELREERAGRDPNQLGQQRPDAPAPVGPEASARIQAAINPNPRPARRAGRSPARATFVDKIRTAPGKIQAALVNRVEDQQRRRQPVKQQVSGRIREGLASTRRLRQQAEGGQPPVVAPERLYQIHEDALTYFRRHLAADHPRAAHARSYLEGRGVPAGSPRWRPGYAPPGWTKLVDVLRQAGYSDAELEQSGLAARTTQGTLIDRFRDRVMLPIGDDQGRTIAFVGRPPYESVPHKIPKYLNSPNTAIYSKRVTLFGVGQGLDRRASTGPVVWVEGPFDAIAIERATARLPLSSRPLVVAACGTAITAEQVAGLAAIAAQRELITMFDSDRAGRQATRQIAQLTTTSWSGPVTVAGWSTASDPSALLADQGPDAVCRVLQQRQPILDVLVDESIESVSEQDRAYPEGQVLAARRAAAVIAETGDDAQTLRQVERVMDRYPDTVAHSGLAIEVAEQLAERKAELGTLPTPQPVNQPGTAAPGTGPSLVPLRQQVHANIARHHARTAFDNPQQLSIPPQRYAVTYQNASVPAGTPVGRQPS